MAIQNLIKVGNSYAVTIPREYVTSLNIKGKHKVKVTKNEVSGKIEIDFLQNEDALKKIIDPEVYSTAKDLLNRYLPAFKDLADK